MKCRLAQGAFRSRGETEHEYIEVNVVAESYLIQRWAVAKDVATAAQGAVMLLEGGGVLCNDPVLFSVPSRSQRCLILYPREAISFLVSCQAAAS